MSLPSTTPVVQLDNLGIGYKRKMLFAPFSLSFPNGTINVVIGANGSGKTTLLSTISGALVPVTGQVFIEGRDVTTISARQLSRLLSITGSERTVSGGLTVWELVSMGRYPYTGVLGRLSVDDCAIVEKAIADVGVSNLRTRFLSDISDGERQKAMIARALAQQTPVMMFDEPTNFLDAASRLEILHLIAKLVREKGITAILTGHDTATLLELADNVITILPSAPNPVEMHQACSEANNARLEAVFAHRGVHYDPESLTFRMG